MRTLLLISALALAPLAASAQTAAPPPVRYELRFDNAVHHEAQIAVTFADVPVGPLRVRMSRSSPGRYAIHEFAKNVYSVRAVDGAGRALTVERSDPYGWTIPAHDGTVTVTYTLFADRADGTYSQIDATHAHLNMPATLLWAEGFEARPVELRFTPLAADWKIATQLPAGQAQNSFTAPNLQYLMDSPAELSAHVVREWPVDDAGTNRTIRIALHHRGSDADADRYAEMAKKVVAQQIAVFGDVPDFDHGSYTFLADYLPHVSGDGMEHRNSTWLTDTAGLAEDGFAQIDTLSHEFFHAWNVERLRPAELEPFDFTRANATPSLWFAEGFTTYYGPLTVHRAGIADIDAFLMQMSAIVDRTVNGPGRRYGSPIEMSLRAPFNDAATAIDPRNTNIFTSYYIYGATIAMLLDLELRGRFDTTLDAYMRRLWQMHGRPEKPYRTADLRNALATVSGDRAFADRFFASTIEGTELPELAPLLAQAGLAVAPARSGWVGNVTMVPDEGGIRLNGLSAPGTPLYAAGITQGDRILRLGNTPITTPDAWAAAVAAMAPGSSAELVFVQRGIERRATLTAAADPTIRIVRAETLGTRLTPAQRSFRAAWLGALPTP
ncbi:M61 family metallopeptidase [Sphingomonas baiyangensis]|uniref:M61 family metallopeptidase n=2 Tax=Sphingomonas baiyangensis TaxID=2572576 RepID=A0A4U1L7G9_9SPHN|nr:M61 family metallopeptidase [Sphingomonas baiyangensis]